MSAATQSSQVPTLFPYQVLGAKWLASQTTALLADPMGLGKTIQAISGADLADVGRVVVVCPAVACTNWGREFSAWQRISRPVVVVQGPKDIARIPAMGPVVVVMSWDRVRQAAYADPIKGFGLLILDEAHYAKERSAKRTQAVLGPKCSRTGGLSESVARVWALTGTPAPNHAAELWPIVHALAPHAIMSRSNNRPMDYWQFVNRFCRTVDNGFGIQIVGSKNQGQLKDALVGFVLRRRVEDVLKDLPPIRYATVALDGGVLATQVRDLEASEEGAAIKKVLAATKDPDLKKLQALQTHIASLRRLTELAKVPAIIDMLSGELESDLGKVVVFAQHRHSIEQLSRGFEKYGVVTIHGGVSAGARTEAIDRFQNDPTVRVFIGQLVAAGTAITLTAASNVVFASASWVPADNAQAAKRCHRIGQTRPVLVRFALLANSLDEQVTAVVRRKTAEIGMIFD